MTPSSSTAHAAGLSRAGALLAVTVVLLGVPAALVGYVGWPLPKRFPATWNGWVDIFTGEFNDTTAIKVLAVAVWAVWGIFCYSIATETVAKLRGCEPRSRIRVFSPVQAFAALLVAGIAATSASPVAAAATASPSVHATTSRQAEQAAESHSSVNRSADPPAATAAAAEAVEVAGSASTPDCGVPRLAVATADGTITVQAAGTRHTVAVKRGDTLWDIADRWLDDPHRWPEIYHLNRHRYDENGRMRGGDHIEPGWVLRIPDDANPPPGAGPHSPDQPPDQPPPTTTAPPPDDGDKAAPPNPPPGDDGAVPMPSATTPTPPAPSTTPGTPTTPATPTPPEEEPADTRPRTGQPFGVDLPSAGWAELGLAAAVAAAAAAVWLHRRRRYTPRPPSPTVPADDPSLAPLPATVRRLRRAASKAGRTDSETTETEHAETEQSDIEYLDSAADDTDAPGQPVLSGLLTELCSPAGLGLIGAGAQAAARGLLASMLAADVTGVPEERGRVVLDANTLSTLLGAAAADLPPNPRLIVTDGLPEALTVCEEHALHRSRVLYTNEVDNVAAVHGADPVADPLPPVMLLVDAAARGERARIAALLTQGHRLDIHGVLLGEWPDGETVTIAPDGATDSADPRSSRHGAHPADVGRLTVLTAEETVDLLTTLAEAHTGEPHTGEPHTTAAPPPPARQAGDDRPQSDKKTTSAGGGPPQQTDLSQAPANSLRHVAGPGAAPGDVVTGTPEPADTGIDTAQAAQLPDGDDCSGHSDQKEQSLGTGHATVWVLGEPRIDGDDASGRAAPLRSKARELLVYLAAVGGKASQDAVLEDLLPDAPARKAPHRLHTYVYNLRRHLNHVGGQAEYLHHPGHQYVLNSDVVEVDLWQLRAALADAQTTEGTAAKIAALRHAVSFYRGPLADGCGYEWIEPHREGVRQQILNAHLALADLLAADQPAEALAAARAAVEVDPYAEAAYRRAMALHADLGDLAAIQDLRRILTRRMVEIDAEPDDGTLALADRFIVELQRHRTDPERRYAAS